MEKKKPNPPIDIRPKEKRLGDREPLPAILEHPPAPATTKRPPAGTLRNFLKMIPGSRTVIALYLYLQDPDANPMHRLSILLSVLYFIIPLDIISDLLLPFGFVDDLAVFMGLLKFIGSQHLAPYRDKARRWLKGESMRAITGDDDD